MKRWTIVAVLIGFIIGFVAGQIEPKAEADKVVNVTVVTATRDEIKEISLTLELDAAGVPTGDLLADVNYRLMDDQGGVYIESKWLSIPLTAPQKSDVLAFANQVAVPAINAHEELDP